MVSFKLITENRAELYYNKYEYKVILKIPQIGRTRYCSDYTAFKNRIEFLRSKGWLRADFKLNNTNKTFIRNYFEWRKTINKKEVFVRLDIDTLSICSNNLETLKQAAEYFEGSHTIFKRCNVNIPQGIILFKKTPPTKYRVYFKYGVVGNDFFKTLVDLINRYKNTSSELVPSKSLKRWLESTSYRKTWISGVFSLGYNNESDYTMLALTIPEALGQNFKLEKIGNQ